MKKVIKGITYISLMGTVTGKIPISPIINIVGIFVFLKKRITINKYIFPLFLLLFYCFLQTLFITPGSLIKYEFYRYDGNLFPSYLPLLFFSIFAIRFNFYKIVKYYIYFTLSIMIISLYIFNIPTFKAHNALGGFLAEILLIIVAFFYVKLSVRKKVDIKLLAFFFICVVLIIKSDSRGSILGVILSVLFVLVLPKFRWIFFILALSLLTVVEILYIMPYWKSLGEPISYFHDRSIQLNIENFRWWTVVDRVFYLWPRAVNDWLISPIFGIGFSKYNDIPYQFYGIKYLIMFNFSPAIYSDFHAHNSFFHFLAETGIVGLILLLLFIFKMEKFFVNKIKDPYEKYTLLLLLWYLVFASFTEHRFTTPSQAIPFSILAGIVISNYNFRRKFYK